MAISYSTGASFFRLVRSPYSRNTSYTFSRQPVRSTPMNVALSRFLRQNKPLNTVCNILFYLKTYPFKLFVGSKSDSMRLRSGREYTAPEPRPRRSAPSQVRKPATNSRKSTPLGGGKGRKGSKSSKSSNKSRQSSKSKSPVGQDKVAGSRISKQWSPERKHTRAHGFRNIGGATCYRNSMLQCLLHVPVFCNYLTQMHVDGAHDEDKCVVCAFQVLAFTYWQDRANKELFPYTWIQGMYKALNAAVRRRRPHFFEPFTRVTVRGDPLEFFAALKEELSAKENVGETTLDELLQMDWIDYTICRYCRHEDTRQHETQSLLVAMTNKEGAFNGHTLIEDPEEYQLAENEVRCQCADREAQLGIDIGNQMRDEVSMIKSSPEMLIVQLKRFWFDQTTGIAHKIFGDVDFDEQLDLSDFTDDQTSLNYSLHGVILHWGATAGEGHYIAVVRCPNRAEFYIVDDSIVRGPQSLARLVAQARKRGFQEYVLLYQKAETKAEAQEKLDIEAEAPVPDEFDVEEEPAESSPKIRKNSAGIVA